MTAQTIREQLSTRGKGYVTGHILHGHWRIPAGHMQICLNFSRRQDTSNLSVSTFCRCAENSYKIVLIYRSIFSPVGMSANLKSGFTFFGARMHHTSEHCSLSPRGLCLQMSFRPIYLCPFDWNNHSAPDLAKLMTVVSGGKRRYNCQPCR